MAESPEERIEKLEAELNAAKAEIEPLRKELAKAEQRAAFAANQTTAVEREANKRVLEERSRRR